MTDEFKICPHCVNPYAYAMTETTYACPECGHEWNPEENQISVEVIDANGNVLHNGDNVVVVKDLPVKGVPKPIKAGTKVKNIRINTESDHNIDCKIDGFGKMGLKSEFVNKA